MHQPTYSLLESFKSVFAHDWLLHDYYGELSQPGFAHKLLYRLCSSLWATNLRWLDSSLKTLSFDKIRHPTIEINGELHDRREDLATLQNGISETTSWMLQELVEYFDQKQAERPWDTSEIYHPLKHLKAIQEDARRLQSFLMETFQLLLSSLSIQDSQMSVEQARLSAVQAQRSHRISQLVFIYAPLSFVTGIFGMNVREISPDNPLSVWVCCVAGVIVVVVTFIIFAMIWLYERWTRLRKSKEDRDWRLKEKV